MGKDNKNVKNVSSKLSTSVIDKVSISHECKHLNIFYLNARSLCNKIDELKILAEQHKPDIIGIVETWLTEKNYDSEISLRGYNFMRKDRENKFKAKGGGIVIYYREELSVADITSDYNSNIDHMWVKIIFKHCKPISVGVFYRPPDSNEEEFKFLLQNLSKNKTENTVIIGDFNYRDIDWKKNTSGIGGKNFLKFCADISLQQCVKEKTRGSNILDLVLVYEKKFIYQVRQMTPLAKSDHNIINILLNSTTTIRNKPVNSYSYNKANYDILKERISQIDWEEETNKKMVTNVSELIGKQLKEFKENYVPKFERNASTDVPWLTKTLKNLIKKRDNLFKRYKRSGQSYSKIKYIISRNFVTKQIRLAKKKYESKIIKRSSNNRKVFYSYVATKNRKNCSGKIGPLMDQSGKIVVNDKGMASLLNDYFVSVFNKKSINSDTLITPKFSNFKYLMQDIEITDEEVIKTIGEFKPHKSPGIDGITSTYALKTKEILAKPLSLLFNSSIENNIIPSEWKRANITPIFKTGDKAKVENYRPVSLTPFYGKVLEKIIKKRIEIFLSETKLINDSQHGFLKGRSCLSNLLISQESVISSIDGGSPVDIIYLDFQKAFDKVPHDRLMAKIRGAGIGGRVADWLENWLSGRLQRVGLNGSYSEWDKVTSGVPQGSILGPLLFTIFINDLDSNVINKVLKFADDSKLWGVVETVEERIGMQKDLDTLGEWSEINQMPFNVDKCKVMHVGKKNIKVDYKLMGREITKTSEEKDLGVFFPILLKLVIIVIKLVRHQIKL